LISDSIPPFAHLDYTPYKAWPLHGRIQFKDVSLSYSGQKVLKHLSFDIKSGERIGIVGRTGAGKSSIVSALFRMAEPKGRIWIDGVDVTEIGLHDLRPKISIIPQDPQLFSGTIRYNLDPFSEFPDDEIWKALRAVSSVYPYHYLVIHINIIHTGLMYSSILFKSRDRIQIKTR
jgi:ATP-binding cassette subfamily C (CFTR/MRP) protein 4